MMFFAMGMATGMDTQMSLLVAAPYSTIRNLYNFRKKHTAEQKI